MLMRGRVQLDDTSPRVFGDTVSGWWLLANRWNPFSSLRNIPGITEIQARYKSFLHTGSPNAAGFAQWNVAGTSNVNAINLGAPGMATVGACNTSYWGNFVQYDYQVFNL